MPSVTGLGQAEAEIASYLAWGQVKDREGKNLTKIQLTEVERNERDAKKIAESAVRNSFEVVLYVDKTGTPQTKKFTMGTEAMFPALLREKDLRLFDQQIEPLALMPGGLYAVWPTGQPAVKVKDLYQSFARQPKLPKLISTQTVVNTVAEGVLRGLLAVRYVRPDGSDEWFWRSTIPITGWEANSESWVPKNASVDRLQYSAVLPESLGEPRPLFGENPHASRGGVEFAYRRWRGGSTAEVLRAPRLKYLEILCKLTTPRGRPRFRITPRRSPNFCWKSR